MTNSMSLFLLVERKPSILNNYLNNNFLYFNCDMCFARKKKIKNVYMQKKGKVKR